jgi:phosphoribosylformimino-5-aminoimidazole carboxamide ribotide isomerase
VEHLRALVGLRQVNLAGVIVGKALYEQRFTVAEGQAAVA